MPTVGTEQEASYLRRALELAEGGRGQVSPNPMVGAVLVSGDDVIGEGFHAELGGLHAERAAIEDCLARGSDPSGSALYVTLEPCAHTGRQPPCTEAILEAGISRVVYASEDPTDKASGRGRKGKSPVVLQVAVGERVLQPEFVVSVGDLIEGGSEDRPEMLNT